MEKLTQAHASFIPPLSEYLGYFKGTFSIYHCLPSETRRSLLRHIHAWLIGELHGRQTLPIIIRYRDKPPVQLPLSDDFVDITHPIPKRYYDQTIRQATLNLSGCSIVVADRFFGSVDRAYPMLALVDGPGKECVIVMPRYVKLPPSPKSETDPEWLRLHSADTSHIDWRKCLLSLQEAGFVRAERSAVWGVRERRGPAHPSQAKRPGSRAYEEVLVFNAICYWWVVMFKRFWKGLDAVDHNQSNDEEEQGGESEGSDGKEEDDEKQAGTRAVKGSL